MSSVESSTPEAAAALAAIAREVARRRTFAIISHPDAGKTTLTEKLLLYAGAIELAGAVRGRKHSRHVVSDWMDIERERGISVSSAALEFEMDGCRITLLDTPGHQDFSEDTYRTLFAVDSVVMVIDAAKGVEAQTRKLFEVCRLRRLPVLTFVNKLDQPGRDPLELLHEIEQVLGIQSAPVNWPIGSGDRFRGVFNLEEGRVRLYERQSGGAYRAPLQVTDASDPALAGIIGEAAQKELAETAELLREAGTTFSPAEYLAGRQTPVLFGSALANFGLEPLLDALKTLAPPPGPRETAEGEVAPVATGFSGFVFKIQANMNRRHRDRVAFVRVCSGTLVKDMTVINTRLDAEVRVSRPYRFFGGVREILDVAYPGDVVGMVNPGQFAIGDTLYAGTPVHYPPVPRFPPEHFGLARLIGARFKQLDSGVRELEEEGLMQVVYGITGRREPILGVVGPLQLDVVEARLKQEYNAECRIDRLKYTAMRWLKGEAKDVDAVQLPSSGVLRAVDRHDRPVVLFESDWHVSYSAQQNPKVEFSMVS